MRPDAVTVRTSDIASGDFTPHSIKAVATPRQHGHLRDLRRWVAVVELENPDVAHMAVDARVLEQIRDEPATVLGDDPALSDARLLDVVLPVREVVTLDARAAAGEAPTAPRRKLRKRSALFALLTVSGLVHPQLPSPQSSLRRGSDNASTRRLHVQA
jgi:hypothetical protein